MSDIKEEALPLNYLKIFFRRKEMIIIPTFIGLILGICAGIILPRKYVSTSILLVEEGKTDNPLFNQLTVSTTVQQRLTAIRESMLGWNSLVKLIKRLGMDKEIKTPRELQDTIEDIKKHMSINLRGQNIIDLRYEGDEPELTRDVVKTITDLFIERNVEIQNLETSDAIDFIEDQLKVYRGKIKSAEIAQLKDQLKALLIDSTEKHPRVKELRDLIDAKEDELRQEKLEFYESAGLNSDTTNPLINEIRKALDNLEGSPATSLAVDNTKNDFYKVMLIDKLDNVLARDVDVNNTIYNMLLQRLETAKITQRLQSSKEGTKYTVLDPPRVPLDPDKPNRIIVATLGLVLGIIIGIGIVVSIEFLDKSFIDVEDAKQFLGVPLMGAISKINTEESIRKEKEKVGWMYSLMFVAGFVVIIITTAISNYLR